MPGGVEAVPPLQVGLDLGHAAAVVTLPGPAPGPLAGAGREIDLEIGVGEHHRADVATLHHAGAALGHPPALLVPPAWRAPRVGGHGRHGPVHRRRADGAGDVAPVDRHPVTHLDGEAPGQLGHRRRCRRGSRPLSRA